MKAATITQQRFMVGFALNLTLSLTGVMATQTSSLDRAKKELEAGSYGKVLKILQSIDDVASANVKARALFCLEAEEASEACLDQALKLDPSNAEATNLRWCYLLRWKNHAAEGLAKLQALFRVNPRDVDVRSMFGRALYASGRTEEGMQEMLAASKMEPRSWLCSINLANSYFEQLDDKSALSIWNAAINLHPQSPEPLLRRGQLYEHSGHSDLALADYSKAIEISPACPVAYYHRASILFDQGNYKKALDDCRKAMAADETHVMSSKILRVRVKSARKLGLLPDAVAAASTLLKDVPKRKKIDGTTQSDLLALASDLETLKQYRRALETIQIVQHFNPGSTSASFTKAKVCLKLGDYKSSLVELNSLLARDAMVPEWYKCRADVLEKLGKEDAARADRKKAEDLNGRL